MPNIDDLRRYAVVDPAEDSRDLEMCMAAAQRYFANSGVPVPENEDPLYDLGIYMLAVHYYDNRGGVGDKTAELPFGVCSIIRQLSL